MSEVKVNKISPRTNCGTVTLGDSGDTFTIPSGATITNAGTASGFGATGAISWNTTKITADPGNAVSGTGYFCDTSGGAFTVTLPTSPSAGDIVAVSDYTRTFGTNALGIGRNSKPMGGVASDAELNVNGQSATFVFVDDTEGWINTQETQTSQTGLPPYMVATVSGACNTLTTVCTDYKLAKFVGPGTFCVAVAGTPSGSDTVDYLVVAGGGGGGGNKYHNTTGGGAGGGGLRASADTYTIGAAPAAPLVASPAAARPVSIQGYPITVGAGGAGGTGSPGNPPACGANGANSVFDTITSAGGGFGGMTSPGGTPGGNAGPGGSGGGIGGGGPFPGPAHGTGNDPATTPPQGNPGGTSVAPACTNIGAAGGGGAIATGTSGSPSGGGAGGAGAGFPTVAVGTTGQNCGSYYYFSGGAGGSTYMPNPSPGPGGAGGLGGGAAGKAGDASPLLGVNGLDNTGGGASSPGGSCTPTTYRAGGTGGSGIVIIRYKFQN